MKMPRLGLLAAIVAVGALSASTSRATIYNFNTSMSGPAEFPANASPGTGFATVDFDTGLNLMTIQMSWSGLTGTTTASHIHAATSVPFAGTAGVATTTPFFAGFPIGVTSGSYSNTLDMTLTSSYNSSYISANGGTTASAEAALLASIMAGTAYLNIHSTTFGGGEIRGFLVPVPEPGTAAILGLGVLPLIYRYRKNRSR